MPNTEESTLVHLSQALAQLSDVQLELDRERLRRQDAEVLSNVVITSMSDAMVEVDPRGLISRVNEPAARLVGAEPEELLGRPVAAVLGTGVPASPWEIYELDPSGRPGAFEAAVRTAGGEVPVSVSCAVLRDAFGKVMGGVYAARDLSETQRLMVQVREAELRWRLLAAVSQRLAEEVAPREALPDVARRTGEATGCAIALVLFKNPFVDAVVSHDPEGLLAPASIAGAAPDSRSALASCIGDRRLIHAPRVRPDFPLLGASGLPGVASAALIPLEARGSALGALIAVSEQEGKVGDQEVALVEQVAGRVAQALANAELQESLAHLQAAQEAARFREELLAGVSHDMQTPLAVISGFMSMLEAHPDLPGDERIKMYRRMGRQLRRLRRLVIQFLDYSRFEAGRPLVVSLAPTDLKGVIEQATEDLLQTHPVEVEIDPNLPLVLADGDRLEQVLANLLSNAQKFSPPGSPITIAAEHGPESVAVSVIDRGRGIAPDDLANLFDKFYRGYGAKDTAGTGLGLYVSRALVEAQHGRISADSHPGEGSRFTITLPRHEG